jgi:hypothetical protein
MKQLLGCVLMLGLACCLSGCEASASASPADQSGWSAKDSQEALEGLRAVREQGRLLSALNESSKLNSQLSQQMQETLGMLQGELAAVKVSLEGVEQRLDNFPTTETDRTRVAASVSLAQPVQPSKVVCGPKGCGPVAQAPAFNLLGGEFQDGTTPEPVDPARAPQFGPIKK